MLVIAVIISIIINSSNNRQREWANEKDVKNDKLNYNIKKKIIVMAKVSDKKS